MQEVNALLQVPRDDVGKYLKLAVRVGAKPFVGRDAILVNDPQRAMGSVFRILIGRK